MTSVPATAEIAAVVREIIRTLDGDITAGDVSLFAELEQLKAYIARARSEIAALGKDQAGMADIPAATDELEAIVQGTEKATGDILDAVEAIEAIGAGLAPEAAAGITDAVTRVYEACNFQDITGQRIAKVVRTLQHIEATIGGLVGAFHGDGTAAPRREPSPAAPPRDPAEPLLNGPAPPSSAPTQDDIDSLFASL